MFSRAIEAELQSLAQSYPVVTVIGPRQSGNTTLVKKRFPHKLYYFRDVQKNEVDLLFKQGHELIPIEIKSAKTYQSEFLKKLHFFQKIAGEKAPRGFLIYSGESEPNVQSIQLLNYANVHRLMQ